MTMDARNHELDAAKADFYQCLAAALLAPMDHAHAQAMLGGDLSRDLAELDQEIGYGQAQEIEQLQTELDAIGDPQALLILYSQLFLAPPRKVQLNAASYLDGSFNGGTVSELEQCYAENGIGRDESFHDLADHVTMQLEFIAHLYRMTAAGVELPAISAGSFIARYPERWIIPMVADITQVSERESLAVNPYRQLLRILEAAVLHDAESTDGPVTATERRERALVLARQRRAERAVSADEMREIRKLLEEKGLSTDHLDADGKGDPFAGWQAMVPPSVKR
jgi:TorA maturation chaperone TorD